MKLVSDFAEIYDAYFDRQGPEFRRVGTEGHSKQEQFRILQDAGFLVPPHGRAGDVVDSWWEEEHSWVKFVVVYDDPMAHTGEGKRLLHKQRFLHGSTQQRSQAIDDLNDLFCSAFVGNGYNPTPSTTWRRLQIGPHKFMLEYTSFDDWRSNCGEGECRVLSAELDVGYHRRIRLPLWAIDFAIGKEMYAIDFNNAPGIRGSGVEQHISHKAIHDAIVRASQDLSP